MHFLKYQALGNDYLVLDPRDYPGGTPPTSRQIRVICHRNFGVGSDSILWEWPMETFWGATDSRSRWWSERMRIRGKRWSRLTGPRKPRE